MEIKEIRDLILTADPYAKRYKGTTGGGPYTTWAVRRQLDIIADDEHEEAWAFTVDHFATSEDSETARRIRRVLDSTPGVAYAVEEIYEQDAGYIHHAFTCEGY